jgi:hypothetical protein
MVNILLVLIPSLKIPLMRALQEHILGFMHFRQYFLQIDEGVF